MNVHNDIESKGGKKSASVNLCSVFSEITGFFLNTSVCALP